MKPTILDFFRKYKKEKYDYINEKRRSSKRRRSDELSRVLTRKQSSSHHDHNSRHSRAHNDIPEHYTRGNSHRRPDSPSIKYVARMAKETHRRSSRSRSSSSLLTPPAAKKRPNLKRSRTLWDPYDSQMDPPLSWGQNDTFLDSSFSMNKNVAKPSVDKARVKTNEDWPRKNFSTNKNETKKDVMTLNERFKKTNQKFQQVLTKIAHLKAPKIKSSKRRGSVRRSIKVNSANSSVKDSVKNPPHRRHSIEHYGGLLDELENIEHTLEAYLKKMKNMNLLDCSEDIHCQWNANYTQMKQCHRSVRETQEQLVDGGVNNVKKAELNTGHKKSSTSWGGRKDFPGAVRQALNIIACDESTKRGGPSMLLGIPYLTSKERLDDMELHMRYNDVKNVWRNAVTAAGIVMRFMENSQTPLLPIEIWRLPTKQINMENMTEIGNSTYSRLKFLFQPLTQWIRDSKEKVDPFKISQLAELLTPKLTKTDQREAFQAVMHMLVNYNKVFD